MTTTSITMPNDFFEKIRDYCNENDLTLSQVIRKQLRPIIENG
jgi:predicted DNA-binding ribbon-helix-helix protein|tara:strand:- start:734 stop:862 length:129 start_codon:yes stop_codon:yes gene_type:complete